MRGYGTARRVTPFWLLSIILTILSPAAVAISELSNLNKYIDIFPPTYFVKVYFDTLVSENLGPSKIPLTLINLNKRKYAVSYYNSSSKYPLGS
jgi:hypothetical protein